MNTDCPYCDKPLRNPKSCECGWEAKAVNLTQGNQWERNKENAKRLVEYVKRLNTPYEPGQDG
jgi:uncharacterized C2H2 Zn-finger protein